MRAPAIVTVGAPRGKRPQEMVELGVFYVPSQGVTQRVKKEKNNSFTMGSNVAYRPEPEGIRRVGLVASFSHSHNAERRIDMLALSSGSPSKGEYALGSVRNGEKHGFIF